MTTTIPQIDLYNHPEFLTILHRTADCAKNKMPDAEARILRASMLVLNGQVHTDRLIPGAWIVDSESQKGVAYQVIDNVCTCESYTRHQAADSTYACKHTISTWLYRRVAQRLTELSATPAPCATPVDTDGTPCQAAGEACAHHGAQPALPEAPASVNVRIQVQGRDVQFTLRDTCEDRLVERLEALLQRFPLEQPLQCAAGNTTTSGEGWCSVHSLPMRQNEKEGRTWYSHKVGDTWCKGKI